jgi:hypothetical protein
MKHHTVEIEVAAKKGHTQKTRWLVSQDRPYPCVRADAGRLNWSNAEGLLGKHGSKPEGLGSRYTCHLLTPEGEIPEDYNRTHFAGYSHRPGPYGTPDVVNPGTIVLRGHDLGEMSVKFGSNPEYPDISVRGYGGSPTPSERDWIKAEIVPALRRFIADNAETLRRDALAAVEKRLAAELEEKRQELAALAAMVPAILANA